jgi:hypothetical protein
MKRKVEKFWLEEDDPAELRRRANDLIGDGFFAIGQQLLDRAAWLDERQKPKID